MTIRDLLEVLKDYDPDAKVVIYSDQGECDAEVYMSIYYHKVKADEVLYCCGPSFVEDNCLGQPILYLRG